MGTKDFSNGGLAGIVFACVIFVYLLYRAGVYLFDGHSFDFLSAVMSAVPAHWREDERDKARAADLEMGQFRRTSVGSGTGSRGSIASPRASIASPRAGPPAGLLLSPLGSAVNVKPFAAVATPKGVRTPRALQGPASSMWVDGRQVAVPDELAPVDHSADCFYLLRAPVDGCRLREESVTVSLTANGPAEESVQVPVLQLNDGAVGEFVLTEQEAADASELEGSQVVLSCSVSGESGVPCQLAATAVLVRSLVEGGASSSGKSTGSDDGEVFASLQKMRAVVRFQLRVRDSNSAFKFNAGNYGLKVLCVGDAAGGKLLEKVVDVLPDDSVRPPDAFEYADALTGAALNAPVTLTTARDGKFASVASVPRGVPTKVVGQLTDGVYEFSPVIAKYDAVPQKLLAFRGLRRAPGSTQRLYMHPSGSLRAGQARVVLSWTGAGPGALSLHVASSRGEHVHYGCREAGGLQYNLGEEGAGAPQTATVTVEAGVEYRFYVSQGSNGELTGGGPRLEHCAASMSVFGVEGLAEMRMTRAACRYEPHQGYWLAFKLLDGRVTLLNWVVESSQSKKEALVF